MHNRKESVILGNFSFVLHGSFTTVTPDLRGVLPFVNHSLHCPPLVVVSNNWLFVAFTTKLFQQLFIYLFFFKLFAYLCMFYFELWSILLWHNNREIYNYYYVWVNIIFLIFFLMGLNSCCDSSNANVNKLETWDYFAHLQAFSFM